jgi:hypothetical protein
MGDTSPLKGEAGIATKSFRGSAIKGSSLINTQGDIRAFVQRGATIRVGGGDYQIATVGEWAAGCVQIATDFAGDTNFELVITIPAESYSPKRKKAHSPVKNTNILQAVESLDGIKEHFDAKLRDLGIAPTPKALSHIHTESSGPTGAGAPPVVSRFARGGGGAVGAAKRIRHKPAPSLPPATEEPYDSIDEAQEAREAQAQKPPRVGLGRKLRAVGAEGTEGGSPHAAHKRRGSTGSEPADKAISGIPLAFGRGSSTARKPNSPKRRMARGELAALEREGPVSPGGGGGVAVSGSGSIEPVEVKSPMGAVEQRKAAAARVRRKLKEDLVRVEKLAEQDAAAVQQRKDACVTKTKELQEITAQRVEAYKLEKLRRAEDTRRQDALDLALKAQKEQALQSDERHRKLKQMRRESKHR